MELTSREAATIAYALTALIFDDSRGIDVTREELRDLSTKILRTQYKAKN